MRVAQVYRAYLEPHDRRNMLDKTRNTVHHVCGSTVLLEFSVDLVDQVSH